MGGQQQQRDQKSSLEILRSGDAPARLEKPEMTAATAAEAHEAGSMRVKTESLRGRAGVSLKGLEERSKERAKEQKLDTETAQEINRINLTGSAELQRGRLDRLRFVTIAMTAKALHEYPAIEQKFKPEQFINFPLLAEYLQKLPDSPSADNAALHKLSELYKNPDSPASQAIRKEWPAILQESRKMVSGTHDLQFAVEHPEKPKSGLISKCLDTMNNHPWITLGIGAAACFGVYKLISKLWNREKTPEAGAQVAPPPEAKAEAPAEKQGFFSRFWKWILGTGGVIGLLFGAAKLLGIDKFSDLVEKVQKGYKDLKEKLGGEESDENADFYKKAAKLVGEKMHCKMDWKNVSKLRDEKFEDFMGTTSQWGDDLSNWVGEKVGMLGKPFLDSKKENDQQIALRNFFKRYQDSKELDQIVVIREETTVGEVLMRLYEHITKEKVTPPEAVVAGAAAATAGAAVAGGAAAAKPAGTPEPLDVKGKDSAELLAAASTEHDRDAAIEALPVPAKTLALENERLLTKKIKTAEIVQLRKRIADIEQDTKASLERAVDASMRQELTAKLAKITEAKQKLEKLIQEHAVADAAYYAALGDNSGEENISDKFEKLIEAKEKIEEVYGEIEPQRRAWTPLPFLLYRYALQPSRIRKAFREQARRALMSPGVLVNAVAVARDPVGYYTKQLAQTEKELADYEQTKGLDPADRDKVRRNLINDAERNSKIRTRDLMEKRLTLAQKQLAVRGLTEAERVKTRPELLSLEKAAIDAEQASLRSNISYAKSFLNDAGSNLSDREKISFYHDIHQQRVEMRENLKVFSGRVMSEAERLGKASVEGQKLVRELDQTLDVYRQMVRDDLSCWGRFVGESKGLRKAFREWVRAEGTTGFTKFIKNPRLHTVGVAGLCLAPAMYFKIKDIKEANPEIGLYQLLKELGPDCLQLLADVCPFTFGASDWYTVKSGKEYFTQRNVQGFDRYGRIIWGSLGALLDAASLIPAVDLAGAPANAIMRVARLGGKAKEAGRIIKMWPRIKAAAEAVGGWKKFAEHLKAFKSGKGIAKLAPAARMVQTAAPRLMATAMVGGITYNAVYSMGEDTTDKGEQLPADLVQEMEAEAGKLPEQTGVAPEAPPEQGEMKQAA